MRGKAGVEFPVFSGNQFGKEMDTEGEYRGKDWRPIRERQ